MLFVSLFGLVAILVVLSLANALLVEYRQVEDSLTGVRAYWAAMGQANYVLSRIRQSGGCVGTAACGGSRPAPPATGAASAIQTYLTEVQTALDAGVTPAPAATTASTWQYPDVGSGYQFYVNGSSNPDNLKTASPGEYCLRFTFSPLSSTKPAAAGACAASNAPAALPGAAASPTGSTVTSVQGLRSLRVTRPLEMRFCITSSPGLPCGCTSSAGGSACNSSNGSYGSIPFNYITSVHRPAS